MKIFSSGGGVQSTAALVLSAQGKLDFRIFVFANTGDDSEHPATLDYVRNITMPYAEKNGIDFHEIQKTRFNEPDTVYEAIYRNNKSVPLPIKLNTGAPGNRKCTVEFKIRTIDKWIAENGGKNSGLVAVGLGITIDEIHRARIRPIETIRGFQKKMTYPLIELNLTRSQCQQIILDEGLPLAPRSACWFCPFHTHNEWQFLKNNYPNLFEKACNIEMFLQAKHKKAGRDGGVWLYRPFRYLEDAIGDQPFLFDELENCESGYCMV